MKKNLLLAAGFILTTLSLKAQTSEFKPAQGDLTTEFGLTGGVLNSNFNLNEGGQLLRFRYFSKDQVAYRFGLNVRTSNETANAYGLTGTPNEGKTGDVKRNESVYALNLGIEKHFTGTDRLSPYAGADVVFGITTEKDSYNNSNNSINNPIYVANVSGETKGPGALAIGLRGVVGADYYFAKRVFLGAEAGFGFTYNKEGKQTIVNTVGGNTTTTEFDSTGSSFTIRPNVITGVRVGFVF